MAASIGHVRHASAYGDCSAIPDVLSHATPTMPISYKIQRSTPPSNLRQLVTLEAVTISHEASDDTSADT